MRLRVEFTTEPFDLDEAPAHAVVGPRGHRGGRAGRGGRRPVRQHRRGRRGAGARRRRTTLLRAHPGRRAPPGSRSRSTSIGGGRDRVTGAGRGRTRSSRRSSRWSTPWAARWSPPGRGAAATTSCSAWEGAGRRRRTPAPARGLPRPHPGRLERRHGKPLAELDRKAKQDGRARYWRRAAPSPCGTAWRRSARALGVSRFTVYNYLNRENAAKAREPSGLRRHRRGLGSHG